MALSDVGKRYADRLLQKSLDELRQRHQERSSQVLTDFTTRNTIKSGMYINARAQLLIRFTEELGQAKAASLLKAYEKEGLPLDDIALREITTEVNQYCHSQQHNAVGAIVPLIDRTFDGQAPANLSNSIIKVIENGVSGIMARLTRDLAIKRDEVILDEMRTRKVYAAGLGKRWDVFISHASEDKDGFVRPLAAALDASGLLVWFDESALTVGDSLRGKIDEGLANSRYGIVVLSHSSSQKIGPNSSLMD
jgi:hypothetical protein